MVDTPQITGAPITINQDDGSSKIYDTGKLSNEAQVAVNLLAFTNQFRQVLDASSRTFSAIVTASLTDEAIVELPEPSADESTKKENTNKK